MNTPVVRRGLLAVGLCLSVLAACSSSDSPSTTGAGRSAAGATRDVLVVSNNWDGTADFIDASSFQRLLRLDIIPDKAERMAEIQSDPVRYAQFLGVQQAVGEGHDQYVDDAFLSHDGRYLYVSRPSFADVVGFDLTTKQILWRTPVEGYRADHMAISPDGTRLAVSASTAKKVHILDVRDGHVIGSFASGDQPHENNYSRDGSRIFHASIGTVYTPLDQPAFDASKGERVFEVVDARSLEVLKKVNLGEKLAEAGYEDISSAVRPMAIAPDENRFYFQVSFFHGIVEYDLAQDKVLRVLELPNAIPDTPREQYLLDSAHHGLAMNPDGSKLCVAGTMDNYIGVVHRDSFEFKVIPSGERPYWATTSTDGKYCFVSIAGADQVAVLDYASEQVVHTIAVGYHPQRSRMGVVLESVLETP